VDYGVHLPLISLKGQRHWSLRGLLEYTEIAERLGFRAISANDHLIFPRPWLDGPTALAAVLARTGQMALATTVALPVVRGPVALAKSLAAIDLLSGGRLVVGVGPGSSARDYAAVGIPFEERWKRLEEAVRVMRALWLGEGSLFKGEFYSTEGVVLEPYPAQQPGPPIWMGSWLGNWSQADGPPGRRLAGFCLQHHPGSVHQGPGTTHGIPTRRRQGP
jgi:alkanesulfonate monooxygenase SsuD/methylene tetrahydromethanopterin reductase-like flavin-dependent oxidoreductase (luciferase family)